MTTKPKNAEEFFDALLPKGKMWFSPPELVPLIGRSDQYIRKLFEDEMLIGHATPEPTAKRGRRSYRILRQSVINYLLESANFDPEIYARLIADFIENCPADYLSAIQIQIRKTLMRANESL